METVDTKELDTSICDYKTPSESSTGNSALHEAVLTNNINCVRKLLADNHTDLNMQNKEGKTPVHLAVCHHYHQILDILMERDGNASKRDWEGLTPLHVAANDGDVTSVRILLNSAGGQQSLNAASKIGDSPLHMACKKGNKESARILINNNATLNNTNTYGATPLYNSIANNHEELTWFLLDNGAKLSDMRMDPFGGLRARGMNTFLHRLLGEKT